MAATTLLSDNGVTSGITGYQLTGGNDGTLVLQTTTAGGTATTAMTIDANQVATFAGTATIRTAAGGVLNLDSTTTGTANTLGSYANSGTAFADLNYSGAQHIWLVSGSEKMRITSAGNVGIGTDSPATFLDVTKSQNAATRIRANNQTNGASALSGLDLQAYGGGWTIDTPASGTFTNPLVFSFAGTGAGERMRITSDGNVGIGTSSPGGKLTVVTNADSQQWLALQNTNAGSSASNGILFGNDANAAYGALYLNSSANSGFGQASGMVLGTYASTALTFITGSTERMRIDSSGNLFLNTTNSSLTAGVGTKFINGVNPYMGIVGESSVNGNSAYHLYSTGAGAFRFYVTYGGQIYATVTTIAGASDQRLKENIRDLDDGLASVMALQPRKFDWKKGKGADTKNARGFIAQEFETVFPDLIAEWKDPAPEGEDPYKAVRADLIPVLVKAIQEQQALIITLTERITALENK